MKLSDISKYLQKIISPQKSAMGSITTKNVLVVFGATGAQGGSVVKSILTDPKTASMFTIRAITRDASKPAALALKKQGAEVVTVSLSQLQKNGGSPPLSPSTGC
jgi:hypothetical protein